MFGLGLRVRVRPLAAHHLTRVAQRTDQTRGEEVGALGAPCHELGIGLGATWDVLGIGSSVACHV